MMIWAGLGVVMIIAIGIEGNIVEFREWLAEEFY
jgi:hypothetical protein